MCSLEVHERPPLQTMQCRKGCVEIDKHAACLNVFSSTKQADSLTFFAGGHSTDSLEPTTFLTTDEGDDYVTYILSVAGFRRLHAGMIENY